MAALLSVPVLAGCQEEIPVSTAAEPVMIRNSGRDTKLVLGALAPDEEREAVLREIADKYQADFQNTEIEIRAYESPKALEAALNSGEADIVEVGSEDQASYVQKGLLLDFREYLENWEEFSTLTPAAKAVLSSMGSSHAYLFLNSMSQDLLYYRTDWFTQYNETVEWKDWALCETWSQLLSASEKLGEHGGLAFAGKEKLLDYFDMVLWSAANTGDTGAAYLVPGENKQTVFSSSQAENGVEQFAQIVKTAALPEALEWTWSQALQAFQDGKAGMLLADSSVGKLLRETMPENSWAAQPVPMGLSGTAVFPMNSFTGWGISAGTEDWESAFHFLTFLSNADNNTHYAKMCGTLPIHLEAEDLESSLGEGDLAVEMDLLQKGGQYRYAAEPTMYSVYQDWRKQADENLRQFAVGKLSQAELLSWMDDFWSAAYSQEDAHE